MEKFKAAEVINNARMNTYDIAHCIYLATVEGISGANQNDGYGFVLSAVAELWNIKGNIGNPYGRTKLTGRYKGMGVTENMIQNIVNQYPNGFSGNEPLFDELLGIGSNVGMEAKHYGGGNRQLKGEQNTDDKIMNLLSVITLIAIIVFKFVIGLGWITSFIGAGIVYMIFGIIFLNGKY